MRDQRGPRRRPLLAVWATSAVVLLAGTFANPASATNVELSPDTPGDISLETTRFQVPFSHSQTLVDATRTTEALGYPVVGYRFENDEIVGEFSPATGLSVEEYSTDFYNSYGTQPEVMAAIIEIPVDEARSLQESSLARQRQVTAKAEGAEYDAPVVDATKVDALLANHRAQNPAQEDRATALAATTWKPTQAEIQILRDGIYVYFGQYYYWDGANAKTTVMHPDDGWEAEVNIFTSNPDFQTGARGGPACMGDYKSQPFAKNVNWNWSALVNTGTGMNTLASAAGAYADYNDLGDDCNRNSMAIGIRSPQAIPSYSNGMQEVLLTIQAPRGADNTGKIGGIVQAVNETGCFMQPWLSNTDCMGLTASAAGYRMTLGEYHDWIAPNRCWQSFNYGNIDPDLYYCG